MYDHGRKTYFRDDVKAKQKPNAVKEGERRGGDRHIFTASAEVIELSSGARFSTRTTDLSSGGCFVDTISPFQVGSEVRVSVHRDKTRFEARGTVVYAQVGLGMGIAFEDLSAEQRLMLNAWISGSATPPQPPPFELGRIGKQPTYGLGSERATLARLVQLLISKGILTEDEGTSIFNDSILL